ncbi:MAG: hypothetical protein NZ455_04235 [Bacteroidia bacterium]|nr:hypothetical protein [Bacteroidia bacterium]MDW8347566.1 hypothetical protein [Bacteroidia bacterium]
MGVSLWDEQGKTQASTHPKTKITTHFFNFYEKEILLYHNTKP